VSAYLHDPWDCPDPSGDHCEEARRRSLARVFTRSSLQRIGLTPKNEDRDPAPRVEPTDVVGPFGAREGEPIPLVQQSRRREGLYLGGGP
jgi:hypothetical protein